MNLTVVKTLDLTDRIRSIEFAAADPASLANYQAGAHIDFDLGELGTRSYSLIDWAAPPVQTSSYTIAVQREDDGLGGSKIMHQLRVNQQIIASSPINDFNLSGSSAPSLLLAGGIGVTPLISMASALKAKGQHFAFHYSGRSRAAMSYLQELTNAFPEALSIHSDDESPLDLASLFNHIDNHTEVYICGPKGMIDAARTAATNAGLPIAQIYVELFSSPDAGVDDFAFEIELKSTGEVYTVPAGRSIIDVLEEKGVDLIYDCQRGDCGICQTKVISGIPDHRDVVLSDVERASGEVMQICVSRSKSPRLVLDI